MFGQTKEERYMNPFNENERIYKNKVVDGNHGMKINTC